MQLAWFAANPGGFIRFHPWCVAVGYRWGGRNWVEASLQFLLGCQSWRPDEFLRRNRRAKNGLAHQLITRPKLAKKRCFVHLCFASNFTSGRALKTAATLKNLWPCSATAGPHASPAGTSAAFCSSAPNGYVASMPIADSTRLFSGIDPSMDGSRVPPGRSSMMMTSRAGWLRNAIAHSTWSGLRTSISGSTTTTILGS